MSPSTATALEQRLETDGVLSLNQSELDGFFDFQARKLVHLSGDAALRRIRAGRAGSSLAWTELTLLSSLMS